MICQRNSVRLRRLPEVIISRILPKKTQETLLKKGIIKKLIPRVYSANLTDDPERIVRKNWSLLLSSLYPGAVLSHRSAIDFGPSPKDNIYLTHNSRKVVKWPGLTVRMIKGHERLEDDFPMTGNLYVSSLERVCLENLSRSRTTDGEKRTLEQNLIEERLIQELNTRGETGLNKLRDRAREISKVLDMNKEFDVLNKIISSMLSTHPSDILTSPVAMATSIGEPYDVGRIQLFTMLVGALSASTFEERSDEDHDLQ